MSGYTIDVDTHVTETPDVWTSRVPDTMQARVPRTDTGRLGPPVVVPGRPAHRQPRPDRAAGVGDMTKWPTSYDEMHPGAFDAKERLAYMDAMGSRRWSRPPT